MGSALEGWFYWCSLPLLSLPGGTTKQSVLPMYLELPRRQKGSYLFLDKKVAKTQGLPPPQPPLKGRGAIY
ncbi:hypothetical protein DU508_11520 [Pedobacter chinensis]|uniref:Uncharacterized protein n=1 Tax=Pedobacter chinensis TaxID=2282421 RepID=A0A369PUH5_9SPHI|nr:hypothetical protein DU508_11520 [Pedobacter chinensis]